MNSSTTFSPRRPVRVPLLACLMVALMLLTGACSDGGPVPSSGTQDVIPARATPTADFLIEPAATPTAILLESPTVSAPKATATPELPAPPTPIESTDPARYNAVVQVTTAQRHPISPLIYGISVSTGQHEELLQWMGVTLVRWGGNARTRHNWEVNASNAGSDWEFRNIGQGDSTPGSASVQFLRRNLQLGAWSLLTIPTIGWVAKDGSNDSVSIGMPEHGGPPVAPGSDAAFTKFENGVWTAPYDPAANRARTSVQSLPSKDAPFSYPPNLNDDKVYQDEWVAYLKSVRPADAPPMIYAMDNEPDLWADDTHVDVHPVRMGYDDTLSNFLTYARAVKKVDPSGLVAGPESWGVTAYTFSALDEGGDGYGAAHDRAAHGNVPFLQWFLRSTQKSDQEQGARSLDVLDIHYYPNAGQYSGNNSPEMQEKRMQAPRALWDTMYVEPSWVARTEWGHLALVRRLNKLIEQEYPGTKLGISEWNFGGEDDISGAIANADAFGIFGREGLYMATYWGLPEMGSPTGWAYRMYRNYDGNGATFGSESVDTTTSDKENLSAYGALNEDGSKLTVMLINKDMQRTADVTVSPAEFSAASPGAQYMYSPSDLTTIQNAPLTVTDGSAHVSLPPTSILLLVMDKK